MLGRTLAVTGILICLLLSLPCNSIASDEVEYQPWELRQAGYHNAGKWNVISGVASFPLPNLAGSYDPETATTVLRGIYGEDENSYTVFTNAVIIGGIIGTDTLVSHSFDFRSYNNAELFAANPEIGGCIRTGNFADDEFHVVYTDTVTDPLYVGTPGAFEDTSHVPMGIRVEQNSYSWSDPEYDNFIILEFVIENIRNDYIQDIWLGFYQDADIYNAGSVNNQSGYLDDFTGVLDTLLYDGDPFSRVLIPYAADNDGDPVFGSNFYWNDESARQAVSLGILHTSFESPEFNYNWWVGNFSTIDYGPRRIGTLIDPFYTFVDSSLGIPKKQQDLYYVLSHPEIDFDQLRVATVDSSSGWIPYDDPLGIVNYDTRFLYSVGSFDLLPGESDTVVIALVGTDEFHVNASDYYSLFNPDSPEEYISTFNFQQMIREHRKVDSVYRSGYQLPAPGAPIGLTVESADEQKAHLVWQAKGDPNVVGYFINVMDTLLSNSWSHAHQEMISDTSYIYEFSYPGQELFFAISAVDNQGQESLPSHWTSILTGKPAPVDSLWLLPDSINPEIFWLPQCDTCLHAYYIYRSVDNSLFELYDSTATIYFKDLGTESGVFYSYFIRTVNRYGVVSDPSAIVSFLPMALDRELLFFDLNSNPGFMLDAFRQEYVFDLMESVESSVDMDYAHIDQTQVTLDLLSRYKLVVFDFEKEGGKIDNTILDEMSNYLYYGGKALFIIPNATIYTISRQLIQYGRYEPGEYFYDVFRLDSSAANTMLFTAGSIYGDLTGCRSLDAEYPTLQADTTKLMYSTLPIEGGIPMAGCLYPIEGEVDTLYTYTSIYSDSLFHNQVNGIRYRNDRYAFVFFNFPLSLMEGPNNIIAFRKALSDLGVNLTCGDYNDDNRVNIGDAFAFINYLYREGAPPPDTWRADIDCDTQISLSDALVIINQIFRAGPAPLCCPPVK